MLLRRTRLGLLAGRELSDSGLGRAAGVVAEVLAREHGWDEPRAEQEVANFQEEAEAEGIGLR